MGNCGNNFLREIVEKLVKNNFFLKWDFWKN